LNILISWPYLTPEVVRFIGDHAEHIRLLVDSGAFTNWKAGRDTNLNDYIEFINGLPITPWRYFSLDRIGDAETTWKNLMVMRDQGLTPVPVFTRGTDPAILDQMYEFSDLVGLGVGVGSPNYRGYVRWITEQNQGRPLHWLGVANPALLRYYTPYSADTSSWEAGARYGTQPIYLGKGVFKKYSRKMARVIAPSPEQWRAIELCGMDPKLFQHEHSWRGGYSPIRALGARCWVRFSMEVESFGTYFFLSTAVFSGLHLVLDGYLYFKGVTCNSCSYHQEVNTASPDP